MNSRLLPTRAAWRQATVLRFNPQQPTISHRKLSSNQPPNQSTAELLLLDHALTKVPEYGWTTAAMIQASKDLGYSSAIHTLAPPIKLISHFLDRSLDNTLEEVDDQLHELPSGHQQLRLICRTRLRQTLPVIDRWPEAAALLAQPQNLPVAMKQLSKMASEFWYLAGDKATRVDWYAKRSGLAAAYLASEMYLCEDRSPDHRDTWEFLDRRLNDLVDMQNAGIKTQNFANQFTRNFYNILASRGFVNRDPPSS
ncbi:Ubiquinone biosynthesis protein coq9, mitochondrial [Coemansia sp. RSA 1722]|nr:Ubiquinone biosynthesis protein coq9, mitochondrial [Coemansia sp. RSA 486]KAJ2232284.1 Ubiquinone biosynthesis protein coq9, mitochondrial [Coemansia sp. RSA 485]KAJ2606374.1 Ubiquinone biosynthesis protein coq9, mitochondrial [Coemansia sp. RSA 1722]